MSAEEVTTEQAEDSNPTVVPTYIPGIGNVGQVRKKVFKIIVF